MPNATPVPDVDPDQQRHDETRAVALFYVERSGEMTPDHPAVVASAAAVRQHQGTGAGGR